MRRDRKCKALGTSLVVQWLRLCTFIAGDVGLIPGQGTKIPHAMWSKTNNKELKKREENTKLCRIKISVCHGCAQA